MRKLYLNYISNFSGLSREIWLLSLVTFINRAGAMVIPFLSLYLENEKGFTLPQVGWIMASFGLGSLVGTWIGGKLTDRWGYYQVIVTSLILGGLGYIGLQWMDGFVQICAGIFLLILVADSYRPAIFVACDAYSKPENTTRSIALIRLAINLGFSFGPVLGGVIIASLGYGSLFWIDGVSCLIAGFMLFLLLRPKSARKKKEEEAVQIEGEPALANKPFMLLIWIIVISSSMFVLYFSLIPLYYQKAHGLSEDLIGLLLFLNGVTIVLFEMPLVAWIERIEMSKVMATFWSMILLALSFIVLNLTNWQGILIIGMLLMTLSEMIGSPFANALALEMAPKGRKGSYMGYYSMSFSLAHIMGHKSGMDIADRFGFELTWYIVFVILLGVAALTLWLYNILKKSPNFRTY